MGSKARGMCGYGGEDGRVSRRTVALRQAVMLTALGKIVLELVEVYVPPLWGYL